MTKVHVSILIMSTLVLPGCAANYGFKGPLEEKASILGQPTPTPTPPGSTPTPTPTPPGPTPTPTPPGPTPTPSPTPKPCTKKVWIYVKDVDAVLAQSATAGSSKVYYCHAQKPDKIDLCAASKDFVPVTNSALMPTWTANDYFQQMTYILQPNTKGRVETATGQFICNLSVPSSLMGKILFKSSSLIKVGTAKKVKFNFDENTVVKTSSTECTLSVPAGGYSLYEQ